MTYKKGDEIGPCDMGSCPYCEDGELDVENHEHNYYTYYCLKCESEIDIEIKHIVMDVRHPLTPSE